MSYFVRETMDDGSVVVGSNDDPSFEVVLKPGQWEQVLLTASEGQAARIKELLEADKIPSEDDAAYSESEAGREHDASMEADRERGESESA